MRRRKPTAFPRAALLVARLRVAEPDLDPVMLDEPLEHVHHGDPVPRDPVARARGVVEHHDQRRDPGMVEHHAQSLAHAFSVLTGQGHRIPHVRMRERDHQAMHVRSVSRDRGLRQSEIHLHHARRPLQLQITVAGQAMLLPPQLHVPLHDRVRAVEPLLGDQPVVHAPGGMTLLAGHEPVRLQPLVDQRLVRVQLRLRLHMRGRCGRAVLQLRVLADRLP